MISLSPPPNEDSRLSFTTLEPNLGVVDLGDFRTFVVADIPGLIEGASDGAGLGDRFLRHVERTKLILHLVDISSLSGREPVEDYEIINRELANYDKDLSVRPQIVVATKIDALDDPERLESLRAKASEDGKEFLEISAVANQGTKELIKAVVRRLDKMTEEEAEAKAESLRRTAAGEDARGEHGWGMRRRHALRRFLRSGTQWPLWHRSTVVDAFRA